MMHPCESEAGFSLIETLMALFIVAMLAAGGGALLMQTLQAGKQVSAQTESLTDLQIAHAVLRDDFGALTTRASSAPGAFEPAQFFIGRRAVQGEPVMEFVRGAWSDPAGQSVRSDLQRVEYRLEDARLIRKAWLRPDPSGQTPTTERVIARDFVSADVRYHQAGDWFEEWNSSLQNRTSEAPGAVEVTLRFQNGDELRQLFLTGARS